MFAPHIATSYSAAILAQGVVAGNSASRSGVSMRWPAAIALAGLAAARCGLDRFYDAEEGVPRELRGIAVFGDVTVAGLEVEYGTLSLELCFF